MAYFLNYINICIHEDFGEATDPVFYYLVAERVVACLYFSLHYSFWTKQDLILNIFTMVQAQGEKESRYKEALMQKNLMMEKTSGRRKPSKVHTT